MCDQQKSENEKLIQNNAFAADSPEQQVEDSIPSENGLSSLDGQGLLVPVELANIYLEKLEIYEGVLRAIASITKVETPADRSAEAFFFVASKMRNLAIAALTKTGAML